MSLARYHNARVQTPSSINILFYVRLTDRADDMVIRVLKESIAYILHEQKRVGRDIIGSIYMEEWTFNLIKKDLFMMVSAYPNLNMGKFIQIWPFISNVYELTPDMNNLLQP
jgi:hypothetical protein